MWRGLALSLSSAGFLTVFTVSAQYFHVCPYDLVFMRGATQVVLVGIPYTFQTLHRQKSDWDSIKDVQGYLFFTAFLAALANGSYILALGNIPMGYVIILGHSSFLFAALFSTLLTNTRTPWGKWLCMACLCLGLLLVTHPPFIFGTPKEDSDIPLLQSYIATLETLLSGASYGLMMVLITEKLPKTPKQLHLILAGILSSALGIMLGIMFETSPMVLPILSPTTHLIWLPLVFSGGCGAAGFMCLVMAAETVSPVTVTMVSVLDIPLACAVQAVFFQQGLTTLELFGAVMTFVSVVAAVIVDFVHEAASRPYEEVA